MTEKISVENMRWKMARFCYDNIGSDDFEEMCRTFGISIRSAKRLALEFAHG